MSGEQKYDPERVAAHIAEQTAEMNAERAIADALNYHAEGHYRTADRIESQLAALAKLTRPPTPSDPQEVSDE